VTFCDGRRNGELYQLHADASFNRFPFLHAPYNVLSSGNRNKNNLLLSLPLLCPGLHIIIHTDNMHRSRNTEPISDKTVGYLSETDRVAAFVVDHANIFLASSLIAMQNLVAVSHTVCAHVGGARNFGGCSGPIP